MNWYIYIPEEGGWEIKGYTGPSREKARQVYLKWAKRKRLPAGSYIYSPTEIEQKYPGQTVIMGPKDLR